MTPMIRSITRDSIATLFLNLAVMVVLLLFFKSISHFNLQWFSYPFIIPKQIFHYFCGFHSAYFV